MSESMELATREQSAGVALLTPEAVKGRVEAVRRLYKSVMKEDAHWQVLPGCKKPSLLQPGAELLATMAQMGASYKVNVERDSNREKEYRNGRSGASEVRRGFIRYTVTATLTHVPTGRVVGQGLGVASNFEPKWIVQDVDGVEQTILQMARKRAFVNAVRTALCASEIFTQDMEDIVDAEFSPAPQRQAPPRPATRQPQAAPQAPPATQAAAGNIPTNPPLCPVCGGEMWDNRDRTEGTKAPRWKCKKATWDKETRTAGGCPGVVWTSDPMEDDRYVAAWAGGSAPQAPPAQSPEPPTVDDAPPPPQDDDIPF